jgi:four helix bundle protein
MTGFHAYDVALELARALAGPLGRVRRHDRALGEQLRRAAASVVLCVGEGRRRAGRDATHLFRVAAGSLAEVRAALDVAVAWGWLDAGERAAVEPLCDREAAMLWRLAQPRA